MTFIDPYTVINFAYAEVSVWYIDNYKYKVIKKSTIKITLKNLRKSNFSNVNTIFSKFLVILCNVTHSEIYTFLNIGNLSCFCCNNATWLLICCSSCSRNKCYRHITVTCHLQLIINNHARMIYIIHTKIIYLNLLFIENIIKQFQEHLIYLRAKNINLHQVMGK